ncbi:MAG TPA: FAD-dependent oxidoreductase [Solirubrobacteraceae bacterium]|nr:FAD-dependent oxidoreductase [Solirubrobacteraceae bacterium]
MSKQTFVIVGAGLAGAKAAEELRERGFDGRVVLIGSEAERPYERPPLSKDYLRGESKREKAYVHPAGFYADHEIELLTGSAVAAIDPGASRVLLEDNREFAYDRLLLTIGAEPRRLPVPGAELDGIHYLRTFADCDALRTRLEAGDGRVAVVGAGWIGSEFAASARQRGLEVTVIDPLSLPNERIFGAEVGSFYRDVHTQHGVEMLLGRGVEGFEGEGTVARVRLSDGAHVECDFAVVGVGVAARSGLARDAGLAVDNGIVVDEHLRTSMPNIYAAGDVANAWHPFHERRIRVEHWANALNQGPAAARSMLGEDVSYERIPYFFSDQYDVGMEYSGYAESWDEVVLRGDPAAGEGFVAFWLGDGHVLAGMNVNVWDVNQQVQELIRARRPVDPRALSDPGTPLDALLALERQ